MFVRIVWRKYVLVRGFGIVFSLQAFLFGTAWYVVRTLTRPKKVPLRDMVASRVEQRLCQ